eukprot:466691-Amphidinium_carterae.1
MPPNTGSTPVKMFTLIAKRVTASIARMPPSGSVPAKWLLWIWKLLTSLSPLSGSTPVKLFFLRAKGKSVS